MSAQNSQLDEGLFESKPLFQNPLHQAPDQNQQPMNNMVQAIQSESYKVVNINQEQIQFSQVSNDSLGTQPQNHRYHEENKKSSYFQKSKNSKSLSEESSSQDFNSDRMEIEYCTYTKNKMNDFIRIKFGNLIIKIKNEDIAQAALAVDFFVLKLSAFNDTVFDNIEKYVDSELRLTPRAQKYPESFFKRMDADLKGVLQACIHIYKSDCFSIKNKKKLQIQQFFLFFKKLKQEEIYKKLVMSSENALEKINEFEALAKLIHVHLYRRDEDFLNYELLEGQFLWIFYKFIKESQNITIKESLFQEDLILKIKLSQHFDILGDYFQWFFIQSYKSKFQCKPDEHKINQLEQLFKDNLQNAKQKAGLPGASSSQNQSENYNQPQIWHGAIHQDNHPLNSGSNRCAACQKSDTSGTYSASVIVQQPIVVSSQEQSISEQKDVNMDIRENQIGQ